MGKQYFLQDNVFIRPLISPPEKICNMAWECPAEISSLAPTIPLKCMDVDNSQFPWNSRFQENVLPTCSNKVLTESVARSLGSKEEKEKRIHSLLPFGFSSSLFWRLSPPLLCTYIFPCMLLHRSVYFFGTTIRNTFSVQLSRRSSRGHTGECNTGPFSSVFCLFFAQPASCGACFLFLSRKGFGGPSLSSTLKVDVCAYSRAFPAIFCLFSPASGFEITTLLLNSFGINTH